MSMGAFDPMDDDTLIGYCRTHSETPRALFHKKHIARILRLAGYEEAAQATEEQMVEFEAVHDDEMHPICDKAEENLRLAREEARKQAHENAVKVVEAASRGELADGLFELHQPEDDPNGQA